MKTTVVSILLHYWKINREDTHENPHSVIIAPPLPEVPKHSS